MESTDFDSAFSEMIGNGQEEEGHTRRSGRRYRRRIRILGIRHDIPTRVRGGSLVFNIRRPRNLRPRRRLVPLPDRPGRVAGSQGTRDEKRHGERDGTIGRALLGRAITMTGRGDCPLRHVMRACADERAENEYTGREAARGAGRAVPPFCVVYMNTRGSRHFRHAVPV